MNELRSELEQTQARIKALEAHEVSDLQLEVLADQLEREATLWEQAMDRGEQRALKAESTPLGSKVISFGFTLLFVGPIVAMVGVSASKALRHEPEWSSVVMATGLLIIGLTSWAKSRRFLAHRLAREWRLTRKARALASNLSLRSGERSTRSGG